MEEKQKEKVAVAPTVIALESPVTHGKETIAEIVLQPLTGKFYRALPTELGPDELLTLAGKLSGLPDSVLDKLDLEDGTAVLRAAQDAIAAVVQPERVQALQAHINAGGDIEKPKSPVTIKLSAPIQIRETDGKKRELVEFTIGSLTARALRTLPPASQSLGPKHACLLAERLIREGTAGLSQIMARDLVDALNPADLAEVVELTESFMLYVQLGMVRR